MRSLNWRPPTPCCVYAPTTPSRFGPAAGATDRGRGPPAEQLAQVNAPELVRTVRGVCGNQRVPIGPVRTRGKTGPQLQIGEVVLQTSNEDQQGFRELVARPTPSGGCSLPPPGFPRTSIATRCSRRGCSGTESCWDPSHRVTC